MNNHIYAATKNTEAKIISTCPADGWALDGTTKTYSKDNLYTYINGEAELYIPYGFKTLESALCVKKEGTKNKIVLDIYTMGSLLDAFGIYSRYRERDSEIVRAGVEGFITDSQLMFYKGRYFIRLSSSKPDNNMAEHLIKMARGVENLIQGNTKPPEELNLLDVEGVLKRTEVYIPGGVLGYRFLKRGITAEAGLDGKEQKVFIVISQSQVESGRILEEYIDYLKKAGIQPQIKKDRDVINMSASEPLYQGVAIRQVCSYLIGVIKIKDPSSAAPLIERLEASVRRYCH